MNTKNNENNTNKSDSYLLDDFKQGERKVTFFNIFDFVIKSPGNLLYELNQKNKSGLIFISLFIQFILFMAVFGLINGLFTGGTQVVDATIKYPLGLFLSALICFPSLYVFLSLTGSDLTFTNVLGIYLMSLLLISIILVGFAPVLWIFSQSTDSISFMGILNIIFWLIGSLFGFRLMNKALILLTQRDNSYLILWIIIFTLVVFQMTTTLRPLIGQSEAFLNTEKMFFIDYWFGK